MLFLIVSFGSVQRHGRHGTNGLADLIITESEHCIVKLRTPAVQRLEGLSVRGDHAACGMVNDGGIFCPTLTDHGQLAAGDDNAFPIEHTDGTVCILFQLQNYILKNSTRHGRPPHSIPQHANPLCNLSATTLYRHFRQNARCFFFFHQKSYIIFVQVSAFSRA